LWPEVEVVVVLKLKRAVAAVKMEVAVAVTVVRVVMMTPACQLSLLLLPPLFLPQPPSSPVSPLV
jgi:hypothetical protein